MRLQVCFSITGQIPNPTNEMNEFLSKLLIANSYSLYVDSLKKVIEDATKINEVAFFRDLLLQTFQVSFDNDSVEYSGSIFSLLEHSVADLNQLRCDESSMFLRMISGTASEMLDYMSLRLTQSLETCKELVVLLDRQV